MGFNLRTNYIIIVQVHLYTDKKGFENFNPNPSFLLTKNHSNFELMALFTLHIKCTESRIRINKYISTWYLVIF